MTSHTVIYFALLFTLNFLAGPMAFAYQVEGTVRILPPFPAPRKIEVGKKHQAHCGQEQSSQALVVNDKGSLQNAVLFLEGGLEETAGTLSAQDTPLLDQKNCHFNPHVLVVPVKSAFRVGNQDPMDHDVRIFSGAKMLERFEMPPFGGTVEKTLDQPGIYVIRCGFHHWMHAFVVVAERPHVAVSGPDGAFQFSGVPAGRYTVRLWHETLGQMEFPIEVASSVKGLDYVFKKF